MIATLKDRLSTMVFAFRDKETNRFLFRITNIGTHEKPDFKFVFTPKESGILIDTSEKKRKDGCIDMYNCIQWTYMEYSYHPDGSFLCKLPEFPIKKYLYDNPEGVGERRCPLKEIKDVEFIAAVEIDNYSLCKKFLPAPQEVHMTCQNNSVFNGDTFNLLIYIKHRDFDINTFQHPLAISYVCRGISETLDIGIYIQKVERKSYKHYNEKLGWVYQNNMHRITPIRSCSKELVLSSLRGFVFP